jgi:hypothetical protein
MYNVIEMGKKATVDVFGNIYWAELIDKSINFLGVVALGSGDFKLIGILELLKAWAKEKRDNPVNGDLSLHKTDGQ